MSLKSSFLNRNLLSFRRDIQEKIAENAEYHPIMLDTSTKSRIWQGIERRSTKNRKNISLPLLGLVTALAAATAFYIMQPEKVNIYDGVKSANVNQSDWHVPLSLNFVVVDKNGDLIPGENLMQIQKGSRILFEVTNDMDVATFKPNFQLAHYSGETKNVLFVSQLANKKEILKLKDRYFAFTAQEPGKHIFKLESQPRKDSHLIQSQPFEIEVIE